MADIKQFVFFDFEMLCSDRGMAFEKMEAIRLGAVKYELETETISYFDQYIRPDNSEPLTEFCKTLTGIKDADLANANDFKEVFANFLEWIGGIKKTMYFSWSPSDLFRLKMDAMRHDISERSIKKIEQRYIDFQEQFKNRVSVNPISVEDALKLYDTDFVGEKHNPMYDAFNTLLIYENFIKQPIQTDLLMVRHFIFEDEDTPPTTIDAMNQTLSEYLKRDANQITEQLRDVYRVRDLNKIIKPIRKTALKYKNVVLNRSGIFTKENILYAESLCTFYEELFFTLEEHIAVSSRIIILHEHMVQPLLKIPLPTIKHKEAGSV